MLPEAKLLKLTEAAQFLGISVRTLRGHITKGRLPYVQLGHGTMRRYVRVSEAHLREFVRELTRREAQPSLPSRTKGRDNVTDGIGFGARLELIRREQALKKKRR